MKSPKTNSQSGTVPSVPKKSANPAEPELVVNGLGLPRLSHDAAEHANDSSLEPDEKSIDIDESVNADKAAAESRDAAAKAKAQGK